MRPPVVIFTDNPGFEHAWRPALSRVGLEVIAMHPETLPDRAEHARAFLLDASNQEIAEEVVLETLGVGAVQGAVVAVSIPVTRFPFSIEDLFEELTAGLVARSEADIRRIAAAMFRRLDADRARRLEYATVLPDGKSLLVILGDGRVRKLSRPVHTDDDGSAVESIALIEGDTAMSFALASGTSFELSVDDLSLRHVNPSSAPSVRPSSTAADLSGTHLGQRLRALRVAAGLTQAELARRTGIHRPNIARVEAGRHTPSLDTIARLAAAIGVPASAVLVDPHASY